MRRDLPYQYASIVIDPVSVSKFENDLFEFADEDRIRVHGEVAKEYGLTKKQVEDSLNSACAEYERRYHIHPANDPYRDLNEVADLFTERLEEMKQTPLTSGQ